MGYVLIFSIFPALAGISIAKIRNRSKVKGFFVGIFFGWIGIILLLLFLKTRDQITGFLK